MSDLLENKLALAVMMVCVCAIAELLIIIIFAKKLHSVYIQVECIIFIIIAALTFIITLLAAIFHF